MAPEEEWDTQRTPRRPWDWRRRQTDRMPWLFAGAVLMAASVLASAVVSIENRKESLRRFDEVLDSLRVSRIEQALIDKNITDGRDAAVSLILERQDTTEARLLEAIRNAARRR